jgi:4-hydroxymandelate oxidase
VPSSNNGRVNPDIPGLHRAARELLPPEVYDYYAGGSGRERTLRANERSWRRSWLAPRVLRDVSRVDTAAELLGAPLRTPIAVAPTAFHCLAHPDGEVATAAGAARAGALLVVSTRATRRIEDIGAAVAAGGGTWWLQVYLMRDRALTADLVTRAAAAGARALVLTGDTPVVGRQGPVPVSDADFGVNFGPRTDPGDLGQSPAASFADIGWLREISGGLPVVVKGVLRPDDALACAAAGAAGVVVSNHGGRQLDGAITAARALPGIAATLGGGGAGLPAYADGGIRTGEDVLAALALGAAAVLIGRPVLWALTCGGADGVADLLTGLTGGLAHAMALAGAATLGEIAGLAAAEPDSAP